MGNSRWEIQEKKIEIEKFQKGKSKKESNQIRGKSFMDTGYPMEGAERGGGMLTLPPLDVGNEEEASFETCQVKGVIFDCYMTLIDIDTDEHSYETYETISNWLSYQGVKIKPENLRDSYMLKVRERMDESPEIYPEVRVEEIFAEICRENAFWRINEKRLGIDTARVFRAASIRKLRPFPQSIKLIEHCINIPKCIISNGQRVFSELELRFLGLHDYFDFVIFSSDVGYKKPDLRLFMKALEELGLEYEPKSVLSIGDSYENEIKPAKKIGMCAMHIEEAWDRFGLRG